MTSGGTFDIHRSVRRSAGTHADITAPAFPFGGLHRIVHLAARFFTSLPGTAPTVESEVWADRHLLPGERSLWIRLGNRDRRHSAMVARRFARAWPSATRAEIAGALLHDVGKLECGLGTVGRVVATVVGPRGARFRAYHDHEPIGAALAASVGSEPATVELIDDRGPAHLVLRACDHA